MNILSELLPGARQIRTPLAIGYLWLLVAWINVTRIPAPIRHSVLVARANHDIRHLSPALVILILSFAAYLTGLFFELLDDIAVKFGVVPAGTLIVISMLSLTVFLWPVTLAVLAIVFLVLFRRSRHFKSNIRAESRQWAINISQPIFNYSYTLKKVTLRVWSNANPVRDDFVADSMVKILDEHPEVSTQFCKTLSVSGLRAACREAGLRSESQMKTPDGTMVNAWKVTRRSSIDPVSENLLRDYLTQRLSASREVRKSVLLRVMRTADVRQLVDRAVEHAGARIQVDQPGVFETCDRLRSEGELRRGIAVPLGVALWSAISVFTNDIQSVLIAAAPAIFIYFSGMKKQEEAMRVLVSFITARITHIDLDISDVRLLQWQTQESPREIKIPAIIQHWIGFRRDSPASASRIDIDPDAGND